MKNIIVCIFLSGWVYNHLSAHEFLPLWQGNMPNSRGLMVNDSIANDRIYQVGTPGMHVFVHSGDENTGAAVLIVPGGGYVRLAHLISGWQLAKWFNTFGVTAFVLSHPFPVSPDVLEGYKAPLGDAQRAVRLIRLHAVRYEVAPDRMGVMGRSAGGHVAACLSTIREDRGSGGDDTYGYGFQPDLAILVSPVITMEEYRHKGNRENLLGADPAEQLVELFSCEKQVTPDTPPAFLVHADNDNAVPSMNSILYYSALKKQGVGKSSLHIFPGAGHSISLRDNPGTTRDWPSLAEGWLQENGLLNRSIR